MTAKAKALGWLSSGKAGSHSSWKRVSMSVFLDVRVLSGGRVGMYGSCWGQATPETPVLLHAQSVSRTPSAHENPGTFAKAVSPSAIVTWRCERLTLLSPGWAVETGSREHPNNLLLRLYLAMGQMHLARMYGWTRAARRVHRAWYTDASRAYVRVDTP